MIPGEHSDFWYEVLISILKSVRKRRACQTAMAIIKPSAKNSINAAARRECCEYFANPKRIIKPGSLKLDTPRNTELMYDRKKINLLYSTVQGIKMYEEMYPDLSTMPELVKKNYDACYLLVRNVATEFNGVFLRDNSQVDF